MRKVLFVLRNYDIGGTTVSTRNLISLLDKDGYDSWVMPLIHDGALKHLYDDVPQVKVPFVMHVMALNQWKKENTRPRRIAAMLLRALSKRTSWFEAWSVGLTWDRINKKHHFDTVIAEQEGVTTRLVSYSGLRNKVAWVRCDYHRRINEYHLERESFYDSFSSIVCVSEKTSDYFKDMFPEYALKIVCIPNPQDGALMQKRADMVEHEPRFKTEDTTLLSVGRFDAVKRFDRIAHIARKLKEHGLRFHWYLIGDGAERKRIEDSIAECGMENVVIMLGVKANPYYYIKRADALVCLSRSEACPRVVNEAKILHTPTLSTDFPGISEFIENEKTGIITQLENMPEAIMRLFTDDAFRERLNANISQFEFDNTALMKQIDGLFS